MTTVDSRPLLADAPRPVREAVTGLLGGRVTREEPATAGFTPSIASLVTGGDGRRLFVKAAPGGEGPAVPLAGAAGDLGPRLIAARTVGDWSIEAFEVVDGDTVTHWTGADLDHLRRVVERMRDRLDPSPIGCTTPYAEAFVPLMADWRVLGAAKPPPITAPVERLAELADRWLDVLAPGTALHHGDLRRDNVIREPGGRLWIVDWTHLWTAPGWMDLIRLLPDLAADGHDPELFLKSTCWHDTPADHIDVALAGLASRAWRDCHLPGPPRLRRMQQEQAHHLLTWLDSRLSRG
ncbi:hypothetical protein GCM10009531_51490 [Actinoplanes capillaceus]